MRLQSSWLIESVAEETTVESVFFPFIHRFSALNWLSRKEIPCLVNTPIDSQALLLRAWYEVSQGGFSDKNRKKFNQVIKNPLDLEMNPFQSWKDRLFDRQQLDYLFYWREAAYEIDDDKQREIFWASVYQIIAYWLSNRASRIPLAFQPDQIMEYVLQSHKKFVSAREDCIKVTCRKFEELIAEDVSLTVFPMVFSDEEIFESELQAIFHSWFHGHADVDQAKKDIKIVMRKYHLTMGKPLELDFFRNLAANSDMAAVVWSGIELPPAVYEQELVEPLRKTFAAKFAQSKMSLKAVDRSLDAYDYLMLFF